MAHSWPFTINSPSSPKKKGRFWKKAFLHLQVAIRGWSQALAPSSWHLSASLCFAPEPIVVNGGKQTPINGPKITVRSGHNMKILTQQHGLMLYALCFTTSFYRNWNTHYKSHMFWTLLKWMRSVQNLFHDLLLRSYFVCIFLVSCLPDFCSTNNAKNQVELLFDTSIIVRAAHDHPLLSRKTRCFVQTICMSTIDESSTCIWMIYLLLVHEINPREWNFGLLQHGTTYRAHS